MIDVNNKLIYMSELKMNDTILNNIFIHQYFNDLRELYKLGKLNLNYQKYQCNQLNNICKTLMSLRYTQVFSSDNLNFFYNTMLQNIPYIDLNELFRTDFLFIKMNYLVKTQICHGYYYKQVGLPIKKIPMIDKYTENNMSNVNLNNISVQDHSFATIINKNNQNQIGQNTLQGNQSHVYTKKKEFITFIEPEMLLYNNKNTDYNQMIKKELESNSGYLQGQTFEDDLKQQTKNQENEIKINELGLAIPNFIQQNLFNNQNLFGEPNHQALLQFQPLEPPNLFQNENGAIFLNNVNLDGFNPPLNNNIFQEINQMHNNHNNFQNNNNNLNIKSQSTIDSKEDNQSVDRIEQIMQNPQITIPRNIEMIKHKEQLKSINNNHANDINLGQFNGGLGGLFGNAQPQNVQIIHSPLKLLCCKDFKFQDGSQFNFIIKQYEQNFNDEKNTNNLRGSCIFITGLLLLTTSFVHIESYRFIGYINVEDAFFPEAKSINIRNFLIDNSQELFTKYRANDLLLDRCVIQNRKQSLNTLYSNYNLNFKSIQITNLANVNIHLENFSRLMYLNFSNVTFKSVQLNNLQNLKTFSISKSRFTNSSFDFSNIKCYSLESFSITLSGIDTFINQDCTRQRQMKELEIINEVGSKFKFKNCDFSDNPRSFKLNYSKEFFNNFLSMNKQFVFKFLNLNQIKYFNFNQNDKISILDNYEQEIFENQNPEFLFKNFLKGDTQNIQMQKSSKLSLIELFQNLYACKISKSKVENDQFENAFNHFKSIKNSYNQYLNLIFKPDTEFQHINNLRAVLFVDINDDQFSKLINNMIIEEIILNARSIESNLDHFGNKVYTLDSTYKHLGDFTSHCYMQIKYKINQYENDMIEDENQFSKYDEDGDNRMI